MSKTRSHDSIERTAKAVREEAAKGGQQITHEQARARVVGVIEKREKRDNNR